MSSVLFWGWFVFFKLYLFLVAQLLVRLEVLEEFKQHLFPSGHKTKNNIIEVCLPKGNSEELSEDKATYITSLTPLALNRDKIFGAVHWIRRLLCFVQKHSKTRGFCFHSF